MWQVLHESRPLSVREHTEHRAAIVVCERRFLSSLSSSLLSLLNLSLYNRHRGKRRVHTYKVLIFPSWPIPLPIPLLSSSFLLSASFPLPIPSSFLLSLPPSYSLAPSEGEEGEEGLAEEEAVWEREPEPEEDQVELQETQRHPSCNIECIVAA